VLQHLGKSAELTVAVPIISETKQISGSFRKRLEAMSSNSLNKGVDTGPVFGYFRVHADAGESHVVTQHRVVLEHLDAIRDKLLEIEAGTAERIVTEGRHSATWGQPWMSAYIRMRRAARGPERAPRQERVGRAFQTRQAP